MQNLKRVIKGKETWLDSHNFVMFVMLKNPILLSLYGSYFCCTLQQLLCLLLSSRLVSGVATRGLRGNCPVKYLFPQLVPQLWVKSRTNGDFPVQSGQNWWLFEGLAPWKLSCPPFDPWKAGYATASCLWIAKQRVIKTASWVKWRVEVRVVRWIISH